MLFMHTIYDLIMNGIYTIKETHVQLWGAPAAPSLHRLPPFLDFWSLLNIPDAPAKGRGREGVRARRCMGARHGSGPRAPCTVLHAETSAWCSCTSNESILLKE